MKHSETCNSILLTDFCAGNQLPEFRLGCHSLDHLKILIFSQVIIKKIEGIFMLSVKVDLIVEVGAGGGPGAAGKSDMVTTFYIHSHRYPYIAEMAIG